MGDERARLDGMGGRQTSNKIRKLIVRNGENQQLGTSCDVGGRKNFGIGKPLHSAGNRGAGDGGASADNMTGSLQCGTDSCSDPAC